MTTNTIPTWNCRGILPPINSDYPTTNRSPYTATLNDFIVQFGTSQNRNDIIEGFLKFRKTIHNIGLTKGFQWINGSFLENIEMLEKRSPNDIDVVTFYYLPEGYTEKQLVQNNEKLFDSEHTKQNFLVDGYFVNLETDKLEYIVNASAYWYSMWSHRRDEQWKGYLEVNLSPNEEKVLGLTL